MTVDRIEKVVASVRGEAFESLGRLVEINSFSGNGRGLVLAGDFLVETAARHGLAFQKIPVASGAAHGSHLFYDGTSGENVPFCGIIGHFDTVHPPDSPFQKISDTGDRLVGPGVLDMKSGILAALYSLAAAKSITGRSTLPVKVIFNCDEETGSADSRTLIEREMKGARAAFIFEGRRASDNALVTARKGILMGWMEVSGRAAHAGEEPEKGANAIVEAAHKITAMDRLTDRDAGITVTTGKIVGGKVANQIPDFCRSEIDIRFRTPADEKRLTHRVQEIMLPSRIAGCTTAFELMCARPPFVRTDAVAALKNEYMSVAARLDLAYGEREAGGGSDGNLTAAMGIPTLDGVGPAGDFAHTDKEYIVKESYVETMKLFALWLLVQIHT